MEDINNPHLLESIFHIGDYMELEIHLLEEENQYAPYPQKELKNQKQRNSMNYLLDRK